MNLEDLQSKLITVARANPPSQQVPYKFERRVMAALRECALPDAWALWARALWRAAAPCVAIMILLVAWAWLRPATPIAGPGATTVDVAQDFENTVLAAAYQEPAADSLR